MDFFTIRVRSNSIDGIPPTGKSPSPKWVIRLAIFSGGDQPVCDCIRGSLGAIIQLQFFKDVF